MIKRYIYIITLNPYYLNTTHSRRCKFIILMFSKAFYLIIILKIINKITIYFQKELEGIRLYCL